MLTKQNKGASPPVTREESLRWVNETSIDTKFQKWSEKEINCTLNVLQMFLQ